MRPQVLTVRGTYLKKDIHDTLSNYFDSGDLKVNTEKVQYEVNRESIADQVYHYIKRLILSGELIGGERIPEAKIAQRFGVSRTPIREALRRLEEYGLVYVKPRSYASVVGLEQSEAEELANIRAHLELMSVSTLAEKGTTEDFDALEELSLQCDGLLAKKDIAGVFEKDSELHLEMAKRTGHRHLYDIYKKIDAKIQLLRLVVHLPIDKLNHFVGQHSELIRTLRSRNKKKAQEIIKRHVLDQLKYYT